MGRVYGHSVLEAFAGCPAKGVDALKPRHGKEGPPRQGQGWHAWWSLYAKHLLRSGLTSDMDEGRRIWNVIASSMSADDEEGIAAVVEDHLNVGWPWFLGGTEQASEQTIFVTLDRRRVPVERVFELSAPVFRLTADAVWRGVGPYPVDYVNLAPDGVAHVMDWKTHHHVEHVSSPANNRQLRRYGAALYPDDGAVVAWLGFPRRHYFEHDVLSKPDLDASWQTHVVEPIERIERMFERGGLADERVVGGHCRNCDLRRGCDAALRYPYDLVGCEDATPEQRLIAKKLAEAIAADHEEALRGMLATRAEVSDGDHRIHYIERKSYDFNADNVVATLKDHLADSQIRRAFSLTKTSIERALKEAGLPGETRKALLEACKVGAPVEITTALHTSRVKEERADGAGNRRRRPPEGVGDLE